MELRQLQTFLTLSELQSFTKTAARLGYAQSNITAQIKQLEQELDGQLFNRLGHSITLTEKGRKLIPYAEKMLSLSNKARESLTMQSDESISILASESLCTYRLSTLIRSFRKEHPHAEFHIQLLNDDDYYTPLSTGKADLAYILQEPISNSYIRQLQCKHEIIGIYASADNALSKKEIHSLMDFNEVPLILTGSGCHYRGAFLHLLDTNLVSANIILETSSLQVIKEMTLSGIGICLLPQMAVERELKEKRLVTLQNMDFGFTSSLMIHKDKVCSATQQAFLDYATEILSRNS